MNCLLNIRTLSLSCCRLIQDHALAGVDEKAHRVYPDRLDGLEQAFGSRPRGPYTFLAAQFIPSLGRASEKTARGQTLVDHCRVACALERYRRVAAQAGRGGLTQQIEQAIAEN